MYLANALRIKNRVSAPSFALTDVAGLKAWYKFKTGITVDGNGDVSEWLDSSGNTSENMDLAPPAASNDVNYNSTTGALDFNSTDTGILQTSSDELNLGAFTIFGVVDVVESGATNEAVIGRAGNDEFRLFRGADAANVRLRANGVNYDINMSEDLPTGKFLFTLIRETGGDLDIRINGVNKGNVSTTITDLFDFTRIGNGSTDSLIYEIAIYNTELSVANINAVEANINTRTGL